MIKDYIEKLQEAILHTHSCKSVYLETIAVKEKFGEKIVWDGEVEVFELLNHPKANQCYAWGFKDDSNKWQYVAVLQFPPVDTAQKAVQAYIISQHKK